jgi:hypothetical protein
MVSIPFLSSHHSTWYHFCPWSVGLCLPSILGVVSGGMGTFLFSQCNMAWRSFVQAVGLGCRSFACSWWFFSAKCVFSKILIYRAHAVCFLPLAAAILDPLSAFSSGTHIHFSEERFVVLN